MQNKIGLSHDQSCETQPIMSMSRTHSNKINPSRLLIWDGGGFRVCGEILLELEKNKRGKKRYDHRSQL